MASTSLWWSVYCDRSDMWVLRAKNHRRHYLESLAATCEIVVFRSPPSGFPRWSRSRSRFIWSWGIPELSRGKASKRLDTDFWRSLWIAICWKQCLGRQRHCGAEAVRHIAGDHEDIDHDDRRGRREWYFRYVVMKCFWYAVLFIYLFTYLCTYLLIY